MSKDCSGKTRRRACSYSLGDLKVKSKERADRLSGDSDIQLGGDIDVFELSPMDWDGCEYEAWRKVESGAKGVVRAL